MSAIYAPSTTPAVEARGLSKSFGDQPALDGLDLRIGPGEIVGLLGPNGAGKTTAVHLLSTLLTPDAGAASIAGADLLTQPREVRSRIGLAGQSAAVDELLTVRENLVLFARLYRLPSGVIPRKVDALLDRLGMAEYADKQAGKLSGGQQRRLDLAAALIGEPPVLLLDEPTTGLDPRSRADLWALIEELRAEGAAILLTTQYLEEADRLADRIVLLDRGIVVAEGTPEELKDCLERDVLIVHVGGPGDADRARGVLADMAGVVINDDELHVPMSGGARASLEVLRRLEAAGCDISDFRLRRPTLDDVFLTLTNA